METVCALNRIQREERRGTESFIPRHCIVEDRAPAVSRGSQNSLSDTPPHICTAWRRENVRRNKSINNEDDDHGGQHCPADDSVDYLPRPVTPAVDIPWLALSVPIPHSAASPPACVPTCRILFLPGLSCLGVAFRAESVHSRGAKARVTPLNAGDSYKWLLGRKGLRNRGSEFAHLPQRGNRFTASATQWRFSCKQIPIGGHLERGHIQCATGKHGQSAP